MRLVLFMRSTNDVFRRSESSDCTNAAFSGVAVRIHPPLGALGVPLPGSRPAPSGGLITNSRWTAAFYCGESQDLLWTRTDVTVAARVVN